jgi:hypothetical protein
VTTNEVITLYNQILQKRTGGYQSPEEIEQFINRAQMSLMYFYLGNPNGYQGDEAPGVAYDRTRRIMEALLPFKTYYNIHLSNGVGTFADDYVYTDAFSYRYYLNNGCHSQDPPGVRQYASLNILSEKEWADRTSSRIDTPTVQYPIIHFTSKNTVEVSPYTIPIIQHAYIRKPKAFYWGRVKVNGRWVYDPNDPLNQPLEWYEIDQNQVVIRALEYMGVSIREQDLFQATQAMKQEMV